MQRGDRSTRDQIHRCLSSPWRRWVLDYLDASEGETTSIDDLIDHVVERKTNWPAPDRQTVTYELYHVHLPMLADTGLLEFDPRSETVTYRADTELMMMVEQLRQDTLDADGPTGESQRG